MAIGQSSGIEKKSLAGAAVNELRIVKLGADDDHVIQAAANSDQLIGIAQHTASSAEDEVRVMMTGISRLKLGGTVTRGDYLTSDANGQGLAAAPTAGVNNTIIGMAMQSGVSGDIIACLLMPSRIQG
ncbi:MAG: DUF2190 family protein [Candidatus Dadabacteria bacterium]|nr:DUF2190 family protein [Candidatus Dadabacteria bacterium]